METTQRVDMVTKGASVVGDGKPEWAMAKGSESDKRHTDKNREARRDDDDDDDLKFPPPFSSFSPPAFEKVEIYRSDFTQFDTNDTHRRS